MVYIQMCHSEVDCTAGFPLSFAVNQPEGGATVSVVRLGRWELRFGRAYTSHFDFEAQDRMWPFGERVVFSHYAKPDTIPDAEADDDGPTAEIEEFKDSRS